MPSIGLRSWVGLSAVIVSAAIFGVAGCGIGDVATGSDAIGMAAVTHGIVHGGPNPVTGATVTLYSTVTSAASPASTYGSSGMVLATAQSGPDGSFTFTSRLACPSTGYKEQAYITSVGGNPGGPPGTTNPNYVLMAALGNCSDLSSDTRIWVDEPSTIAAVYALGSFMTTLTASNSIVVNVGAPVKAAATMGSCTNVDSVVSSCVTAGLIHAFQNAANLVSAVGTSAAPPNGQAYASTPAAPGSIAPQAVINALANALQACVNSTGGKAGDTNACGKLFTDTTPTVGVAPTNTIDALVNLAKNPTLGTSDLYTLATPQVFYSPSLTAAPHDFSLAILYPPASVGLPAVLTPPMDDGFVNELALDSNDNVYLAFQALEDRAPFAMLNSLAAIASNGALIYGANSDLNTAANTTEDMATDTLGNVWMSAFGLSGHLQQFNATTGASVANTPLPANTTIGIAVDRQNNVWASLANGGHNTQSLREYVQANNYAEATFATPPQGEAEGVAIDANQNIWAGSVPQSVFPNTGSSSSPAYGGTAIAGTEQNDSYLFPTTAIDAAGNAWVTTIVGLTVSVPTLSGAQVTGFTQTATRGQTGQNYIGLETDGSGSMWAANAGGALERYNLNDTTGTVLAPCFVMPGATKCIASRFFPSWLAVDSTGSLWVTTGNDISDISSLGLVQVIGSAMPAWPQLSYGHPGVEPQ